MVDVNLAGSKPTACISATGNRILLLQSPHCQVTAYVTSAFFKTSRRLKLKQATARSGLWGSVVLLAGRNYKARLRRAPEIVVSGVKPGSDGDDDTGSRPEWSSKDEFGLYVWNSSWQSLDTSASDFQGIEGDIVTLLTADGMVRIGGSQLVSSHTLSSSKRKDARVRAFSRHRRYREEDYMDPKQSLCLGALFDIAATNGLDMGRRFCVFGFCRSIEMLSDVVKDTVLDQGGEVVIAEKESTGGLHEKLRMTVAMPFLWGVPPAVDMLNHAIRSGGGIVERTYCKWEFL